MTFFTLINKQTKNVSKEYQRHYALIERIMRPMARDYNLGAATRLSQKYLMEHREYPVLSFAHEDGIAHVMLDDGMGTGEEVFLEDMLTMLIDKGEFIEKTTPEFIQRYHTLLDELRKLKQDMKQHIIAHYKKNKGKGRKQW